MIQIQKQVKEGMMTLDDYERAIYYVMCNEWDHLILLMVRTNDDLLAKKIQMFLHNYYYSSSNDDVIDTHDKLLNYIDHAMKQHPTITMKI